MKVKYIHLKPSKSQVLSNLPWKGRKSPFILFTYEDGSTKALKIDFVDLLTDPHHALEVAEKALLKIRRELSLGTFNLAEYFPEVQSLTLKEFFNRYRDFRENEVTRGNLSANTFQADISSFQKIMQYLGENIQLSEVNEKQINRFIDLMLSTKTERTKQPYSRHSINIYLRTLSAAFSYAVKANLIQSNPFLEVKQLKTEKQPRHLEDEEVEILREYLRNKNLWLQQAFEFMLATGIRVGELFDARMDKVRTELIHGIPAHFIQITGKGNRTRWVPCDDVIELIAYRQQLVENEKELRQYLSRIQGIKQDKVLERILNRKLFFEISSLQSVSQGTLRARRACGLSEKISPHSLRHTFAIRFLEEERGDIYTLSQILGHSSVAITEIYLTATPKLLRLRGKI